MKIYVASSWRNPWQIGVVRMLREKGHGVYDFREPEPGVSGFAWSDVDAKWKSWNPATYREALSAPISVDGFRRDMDALRACDACLLVLPCGASAHLELGWAIGAGKRSAVLFPHGVVTPERTRRARHARPTRCLATADHAPAAAIWTDAISLRDWTGSSRS